MNRKEYIQELIRLSRQELENKPCQPTEENCLVAAFFAEQAKLPASRRGICMISCPCAKCNPARL